MPEANVEPWLRGTLTEVGAVHRGVLHALELAEEDVGKWCDGLTQVELEARPLELPSVGFQLRHISRSLDRLLTYAEGGQLSAEQLALLKSEAEAVASRDELFGEFDRAMEVSEARVRALASVDLETARAVGRKQLPTSVGGLLVHVADHTQRHVGQVVTTAKVLMALRSNPRG
jgi:uncharacterized damage-inducible protein DinB